MADAYEQETRRIRQEIGRLRRRVDRDLRATEREGRRLLAWRTYVQQYPGSSLAAALGAGMAAAAGLKKRQFPRWLGMNLVRGAAKSLAGRVWAEIRQALASRTVEPTPVKEPADGRR